MPVRRRRDSRCGNRRHWEIDFGRIQPGRYLEWEDEETRARWDFVARGIEPHSILKDRRGGVVRNLWLSELRQRIDAGESFSKFDWGGCGCGGASTELVALPAHAG